jgi:hypothetical protein
MMESFWIGPTRSRLKESPPILKTEMLLTLLVKRVFSCLKRVAFYLIHIIVKKVKTALLVFADIKYQLKCSTNYQLQLWLRRTKMDGLLFRRSRIFAIGLLA